MLYEVVLYSSLAVLFYFVQKLTRYWLRARAVRADYKRQGIMMTPDGVDDLQLFTETINKRILGKQPFIPQAHAI